MLNTRSPFSAITTLLEKHTRSLKQGETEDESAICDLEQAELDKLAVKLLAYGLAKWARLERELDQRVAKDEISYEDAEAFKASFGELWESLLKTERVSQYDSPLPDIIARFLRADPLLPDHPARQTQCATSETVSNLRIISSLVFIPYLMLESLSCAIFAIALSLLSVILSCINCFYSLTPRTQDPDNFEYVNVVRDLENVAEFYDVFRQPKAVRPSIAVTETPPLPGMEGVPMERVATLGPSYKFPIVGNFAVISLPYGFNPIKAIEATAQQLLQRGEEAADDGRRLNILADRMSG